MRFYRFSFGLLVFLMVAHTSSAKLSKTEFKSSEKVTAGKLFLSQVDVVSLYLSTDHVIYVPRLTPDLRIRVSVTLLGLSFGEDKEALKEFVMRHVNTFNKTLMERLSYYTPELARQFKPEDDVEFILQIGEERKMVGAWKNGEWHWVDGTEGKGVEEISQVLSEEKKAHCRRKCPALIKKKSKKVKENIVEPVSETPPS